MGTSTTGFWDPKERVIPVGSADWSQSNPGYTHACRGKAKL